MIEGEEARMITRLLSRVNGKIILFLTDLGNTKVVVVRKR